ncbi:hypothetical protein HJD18_00145 [Thermoleophilia bacterium SCSIO 60948]|nr:hypothetical protein HJD18_00145 [Thermoleophilia bacterium SCSIO 60948]
MIVAAAAIVTVRARTPDLMLEVTERTPLFTPEGEGPGPREAAFNFFLREAEPMARVEILGSGDRVIRVLEPAIDLDADEEIRVVWDGLTTSGEPAPADIYRLRVEAPTLGRSMIWPRRVALIRGDRPKSALEKYEERGE